jgi:hypothetical protein
MLAGNIFAQTTTDTVSTVRKSYIKDMKISTETTFQNDDVVSGVQIHRTQFNSDFLTIKYDYKVDLSNPANQVNDVLGIFVPAVKRNNLSLDVGVIKLGDWNRGDELFGDVTLKNKFKDFSTTLEIGHSISKATAMRDYFIGRISHKIFTIEGGFLSDYGYSNISELMKKQYYWFAFHPEHAFVAVGNEIQRTWAILGSRDFKNVGTLSCGDYDRKTGDFWFRSQTGFGNVDQSFFSLENELFSTSYLVLPPFFYTHFGPIMTKGNYGFKIDGKKTGNLEKYEFEVSRKLGSVGQLGLGWEREVPNTNGLIIEYFNKVIIERVVKITLELKYETIYSRLSGFITTSYQF